MKPNSFKTVQYLRERDPHLGNKINSVDDLKDRILKIFYEDNTPRRARHLVQLLKPYEGNYLIPFSNGMGNILRQVPGLENENGEWQLVEV